MPGLVARASLGTWALWTSAWDSAGAAYARRGRASAEDAEKTRLEYLDSIVAAEISADVVPTESREMARHIIREAMRVESHHVTDVVVYHTLTPINFLTALIFGAIVRGQSVPPPPPEDMPIPLALRSYEGNRSLPAYPLFKPVWQWSDNVWKVDGEEWKTGGQEFLLHAGSVVTSKEIASSHPLAIDDNGYANVVSAELRGPPPNPPWMKPVPYSVLAEENLRRGLLEKYGCFPRPHIALRAIRATELKTYAHEAGDALDEDNLLKPVSAKGFYNAARSSALHDVPVALDLLPAVRSRLLSVNYNLFGRGDTGDEESSWRMLFSDRFRRYGAASGWAGESPFWGEVFKRQKASPQVKDRVGQQLDAIGRAFDGGHPSSNLSDFEELFPGVDAITLQRARSLVARPRPSNHTAVLLQIAMPTALADEAMYISHSYGWSPDALPAKPGSAEWQQCEFPGDERDWPQVFLRDVWGVPCSDPQEARKYFDATSTAARYRLLKHRRALDLQARLLMTRQASGYEQGEGVNIYAHGSLFQNREVAEVTFALADSVRKALVRGLDA